MQSSAAMWVKANKGLSAAEKEKYINILDKDNFKDSIKW